jgi:hypothetical protein
VVRTSGKRSATGPLDSMIRCAERTKVNLLKSLYPQAFGIGRQKAVYQACSTPRQKYWLSFDQDVFPCVCNGGRACSTICLTGLTPQALNLLAVQSYEKFASDAPLDRLEKGVDRSECGRHRRLVVETMPSERYEETRATMVRISGLEVTSVSIGIEESRHARAAHEKGKRHTKQ